MIRILTSFILVCWILFPTISHAQQHRALLVGVAHYPEKSGWRMIHSDSDVRLLNKLLKKSFYVKTLIDKTATYENVETQLAKLAESTNRGDTILIAFSCHGQQMMSDDKNEPDSLDEALIPYDALVRYSEAYKGEKHLRDDNLSKWVDKIRGNAGSKGLVIVLLDACHSGDAYRDGKNERFYRGGYEVFGPNGVKKRNVHHDLKKIVCITRGRNLSNVLYISACQSYQINRECQQGNNWYGSLTYAFYEAYKIDGLTRLEKLCKDIKKKISEYNSMTGQSPEFATSLDNLLTDTIAHYDIDYTANMEDSEATDQNLQEWACFLLSGTIIIIILLIYARRRKK